MSLFLPEGHLIETKENNYYIESFQRLEEAKNQNIILEARAVVCDSEHNLIVDFGFTKGIIPRSEGAVGIED